MYFGVYGEYEVDNISLEGNNSILIRICGSKILETSELYKGILCLDIEDITLENVVSEINKIKGTYKKSLK